MKDKSRNKDSISRHEERHAFDSARLKIRKVIDHHFPSEQINLNMLDELKMRLEDALKKMAEEKQSRGKTD